MPDLAICRINARITKVKQEPIVEQWFKECVAAFNDREGITAKLTGGFHCPPKPFDDATARLFAHVANCGKDLGQTINWRMTGGVSDGNKLAAAGLPTVDSLGPCGGGIHSPEEYLVLPSLVERAQLTALLLMKLAAGEIEVQSGTPGSRQ